MRFLYRSGSGADRRPVHMAETDPQTGNSIMRPTCGAHGLDSIRDYPLGRPICKRCLSVWRARG